MATTQQVKPLDVRPQKGLAPQGEDSCFIHPSTPARASNRLHAGLVLQYPRLLWEVTGVSSDNESMMLANIRDGLPFRAVEVLEAALGVSRVRMAELLSISPRTLAGRKQKNRLSVHDSDRVARLARIRDAAMELMLGDEQVAVEWLHTPLEFLGNEAPLDCCSTELGARVVEELIGRTRHGVFG